MPQIASTERVHTHFFAGIIIGLLALNQLLDSVGILKYSPFRGGMSRKSCTALPEKVVAKQE
jgi:hypothetical protein